MKDDQMVKTVNHDIPVQLSSISIARDMMESYEGIQNRRAQARALNLEAAHREAELVYSVVKAVERGDLPIQCLRIDWRTLRHCAQTSMD